MVATDTRLFDADGHDREIEFSSELVASLKLSAVLLPSVVLAGIMGMNFPLPIFDDPTNFAIVIVSMVFLAVTTVMVARWRRWI